MELSSVGMASTLDETTEVPTFRPSWEEFKDFNSYINYIETQGAHKVGLAKIIPPPEWIVRSEGYDNLDVTIPMPISQKMTGTQGLYQQSNTRLHKLHIREFEILSNSDKYRTPAFAGYDNLEDKYWKFLTYNQPIYGADVPASLFDKDQEVWNFQRLETILDNLADTEDSYEIMGITSPYLYYGMWCTSQAWSLEDMDLYNVNYLHYGSPRTWYVVPPEHGRRFEKLAAGLFPNVAQNCDAFLRHKTLIIAPKILKQYSIPVHKVVQESGEIIVSFPYAYRSGFNHGFNCSEAINFATERWIEYGKRCLLCDCSKELVRFKMDIFVRNYQPELYEKWTLGQDRERHPEAQYEDVLHPQLVRQMNLHLGLEPGMSDVKPVISDIGSLGQPQGHRVPDTTQILLDAAQLAQEQERQSLAGGSQDGGSSAQTLALPGAREILESLTQQELLELRQQHLHQAMTPATALAAAAKDPTTADVVKVFKQVHTKVMQPQMDLYREAQSKGLVGAEPLSRKRSLDMSQDEAYKQLRVRGALEESVLPTDDGTYKCATCGVEYNTSEELRSHLRTHSREKPYWCGYCGKVFSQEQSLKVHLRIHTGEKPYKCDICERQFTQMSSLNRHFRVHTGERPYKCETCGKDFAQPGTLRDHSMTHTGQKPFKCPVCGKGFIQSTAMKTHERTHSGERPFKCKQCHKAFRQSSLLNIHEKTHLSEKPYVCDICNRGFTTKSFMNIHRKSHMNHSGVATSSTVTSFDHRGGSTSSHSTNLSAIDTNKYLQSPAALVSGIEESLAAVIKQERDSTSAEAAALSVAATALNDLQHHISHRDETSSMVTGRDAIHITPRDQLLRASASNLSQRGDPLGQLRVSTGGLNPRDDLGQLRASSSSMNHREEVDLTPSSNSSLLSPTKLPPASIFKQSSLSTQNMDTLLTADQVIDQALMARSEQAVLDRAMFDRSALERTAAITLQRAAMHAAQTEHTSPTGSMHEIHETSPLHDRVSAAGPFNLHQGSQDTASDMLQQSPQQSAMHDRGKFMNPGAGLNDHNDVDHQSNQIAQQDPSQHPQSMMSDVPTMPHGMHDKTALQYAIAALRDYPDMFQEKVAGAAGHNTATSMAQQMDTAASPPTSNSQPEPGQLSMATSNDPLLESQRINNQIGLSLRDTSALQQVLRDSQTSQPTNQTPLVGRTVTMDLSPEEEAQILQKRSALAQAVSALYTDNMNQQDRTGMLPENLSIQPSDNLTISGGAASQLSPQDAVASPPLNDGASGAETGANDNHHGPGGGGAGSTSGGVSALQLQQLQQVSALHQAANFQQTLLQQAMSLQQAAMQEAATIQRPGSPQTTHQQ